jgi:hypothetical protein
VDKQQNANMKTKCAPPVYIFSLSDDLLRIVLGRVVMKAAVDRSRQWHNELGSEVDLHQIGTVYGAACSCSCTTLNAVYRLLQEEHRRLGPLKALDLYTRPIPRCMATCAFQHEATPTVLRDCMARLENLSSDEPKKSIMLMIHTAVWKRLASYPQMDSGFFEYANLRVSLPLSSHVDTVRMFTTFSSIMMQPHNITVDFSIPTFYNWATACFAQIHQIAHYDCGDARGLVGTPLGAPLKKTSCSFKATILIDVLIQAMFSAPEFYTFDFKPIGSQFAERGLLPVKWPLVLMSSVHEIKIISEHANLHSRKRLFHRDFTALFSETLVESIGIWCAKPSASIKEIDTMRQELTDWSEQEKTRLRSATLRHVAQGIPHFPQLEYSFFEHK